MGNSQSKPLEEPIFKKKDETNTLSIVKPLIKRNTSSVVCTKILEKNV